MGGSEGWQVREWTVDSNLTAIHQSPDCAASEMLYLAPRINIHLRNTYLFLSTVNDQPLVLFWFSE